MIYLQLLIVLSIFDAVSTDIGLREKLITEANPLALYLYQTGTWLFYGWKIVLPISLILFYFKLKQSRRFMALIRMAFAVYLALAIYHGVWLIQAFASSVPPYSLG